MSLGGVERGIALPALRPFFLDALCVITLFAHVGDRFVFLWHISLLRIVQPRVIYDFTTRRWLLRMKRFRGDFPKLAAVLVQPHTHRAGTQRHGENLQSAKGISNPAVADRIGSRQFESTTCRLAGFLPEMFRRKPSRAIRAFLDGAGGSRFCLGWEFWLTSSTGSTSPSRVMRCMFRSAYRWLLLDIFPARSVGHTPPCRCLREFCWTGWEFAVWGELAHFYGAWLLSRR